MMMEPESTEVVIRRICRALRRADGFALYLALVNLPSARRAIALQVIEQLDRPVIEVDVPPEGFGDTTLDGWLLPQLEDAPADSALFLHGLDKVMPTGQAALRRFLQLLNWRRSALASVERPLVLWLPSHALDSMAEYAPDLYDWYSNVYEFASPKEEAEELRSGFLTEFNTQAHPAERLSRAEKEQWLHTLAALLDEHPKRNAYRAKLLAEAGMVHDALGSLEDALDMHQQSLTISRELGDRKNEGAALNNISQIYHDRGDYGKALEYLEQSLSISREIGDKAGEGATLSNIAGVNWKQGNYGKALPLYEQSLNIYQEIGDKAGEGVTLNNLATIAYAKGNHAVSLKYLEQSLGIYQEIGDRHGEGVTLNNIGQIYSGQNDYDKVLKYLEQSLNIRQEIGDRRGEAETSWNIGRAYQEQGDLVKAELYISRTVELEEVIGHPHLEIARKELTELRAKIKGR